MKYTYIFLTRNGTTTLPDKNNQETDVENIQYLGELVTDIDSPKVALKKFLKENPIFIDDYKISDFIIKRFNCKGKTYY